jgi:hypothetical protein
MVYCKKCGKQHSAGEGFCTQCGEAMDLEPKSAAVVVNNTPHKNPFIVGNISIVGYMIASFLILFALFNSRGLAVIIDIGALFNLTFITLFGRALIFGAFAYLSVPIFSIVYRTLISKGKETVAYYLGKTTSFIAITAPIFMAFSCILLILSIFIGSNGDSDSFYDFNNFMDSIFSSSSSAASDAIALRFVISTIMFVLGSIGTFVSIPVGIISLRSLNKSKPFAESKVKTKFVLIGGGAVGALVFVIVLVNLVVSGLGLNKSQLALNYAERNIKMIEIASWSEEKANVNMKCKLVDSNKKESLYVIEIYGTIKSDGENMKGGSFMVIKIDGKDAVQVQSYEYGDMSYYRDDITRSEALDDAKDYMYR